MFGNADTLQALRDSLNASLFGNADPVPDPGDKSAGRYRPMSQAAVEHRDPRELLDELAAIEAEIVEEVEALRIVLAAN